MVVYHFVRYLEGKPQHWRAGHSVVVKNIENVNKMNMALNVTHTINFQNYGEKNSRRSELVLELKRIFQNLNITYHLLPQDVNLSHKGPETPSTVWKWSFPIIYLFILIHAILWDLHRENSRDIKNKIWSLKNSNHEWKMRIISLAIKLLLHVTPLLGDFFFMFTHSNY